jgi:hypothetical protein
MSVSLACQPAPGETAASFPVAAVPAAGTSRRLQALAFMGHSAPALAERLDLPEHTFRRLQAGKTSQVPHALAATVDALYDALWDVRGGSAAAVRMARRRHWCPPLAWDDNPEDPHWIDDPSASPADWQPRPHRGPTWRGQEVADLLASGCSPIEAAVRLGITTDSLYQRLVRARRRKELLTHEHS